MANPAIERLAEEYRGGYASDQNVVTMDSVVQKTFFTMGTVILTALATWLYAANAFEAGDTAALGTIGSFAFAASLGALALSFVISFKRVASPALILTFAALEGVVIGFFSKIVALQVGSNEPVYGAVLGTFVTIAATLAVYKFFNVQVTDRMRRIVMIAMFAFVGISLVDVVLYFFGASIGVNGFGATGFLFSLVGLGIALFMLVLDFDAIEKSIQYGVPERESWRLAFGLTVTAVWIYINLLKILAILRGSD